MKTKTEAREEEEERGRERTLITFFPSIIIVTYFNVL
jgi:hypothetical protein